MAAVPVVVMLVVVWRLVVLFVMLLVVERAVALLVMLLVVHGAVMRIVVLLAAVPTDEVVEEPAQDVVRHTPS